MLSSWNADLSRRLSGLLLFIAVWGTFASPLGAAEEDSSITLEEIDVVGTTPIHGIGLPKDKVPYRVESATARDLSRSQSLDLSEFMSRQLGSVNINAAQNNPLQPDVQFRGFTASPLLGNPQGLAIYQNGIRINEPFGDVVNWDLIPQSAVHGINLIAGANPVFGQNTLGGALSLEMKNGFNFSGHNLMAYGGSFGRNAQTLELGDHVGQVGYYLNYSRIRDDGWRTASPTESHNVWSSLGWHSDSTTLDLNYAHGDTELTGNGPAPVELLDQDRSAIFTSPDSTENILNSVSLEGTHWFDDQWQVSGNAFYRQLSTRSLNGDDSPYSVCSSEIIPFDSVVFPDLLADGLPPAGSVAEQFLCQGGETGGTFVDIDGVARSQKPIRNRDTGELIPARDSGQPAVGEEGEEEEEEEEEEAQVFADQRNGVNNRSTRKQNYYGFTLQATQSGKWFGKENQLVVGGTWSQADVRFNSNVEIASLNAARHTVGRGIYVLDDIVGVSSGTRVVGLYATDTFNLTPKLAITGSARYNNTQVELADLTGNDPRLNGKHTFQRLNPAAGFTYQFAPELGLYGSYSESSRAPTAVELACASPDAPCTLPNSFLADPPLEQVVAESFETGFRGRWAPGSHVLNWSLGAFYTINRDDIIFQTAGGTSANVGFFNNVGDTRRQGLEFGLQASYRERTNWFLNYTFLDATFRDPFVVTSANHPLADDDGQLAVGKGSYIPGLPRHNLKFGTSYAVTPNLRVGFDVLFNSGVFLRGDEANLLGRTDDYAVVNLQGEYQWNQHLAIFARINNLFDSSYESFGLLGEPNEVPGLGGLRDRRFLGPGAPIGGWVGVRLSL